jgi:hypothetical protein
LTHSPATAVAAAAVAALCLLLAPTLADAQALAQAQAPASAQAPADAKPRIDKAADLPRFNYRIDGNVEELVRNPAKFGPFAAALRRDTDSVLAGYEIGDKATQRSLITQLAILDFLEARYDVAFLRAEQVRALQDKPADKLMSGLRLRAASSAARSHAFGSEAWKKAVGEFIAKELAAMPFALVQNEVRELKASSEVIGEALIIGNLRERLQDIVNKNNGNLSSDFAPGLANARYALTVTLALKQTFIDVFSRYLDANQVAKQDIWAARDFALQASEARTPVRLAVWDSGTDTAIFGQQVQRDAKGQPAVLAFDKYSRPAKGELMPIPAELRQRLPSMMSRSKGLSDLQSNIDSPEATEVKQFLSRMSPDQYKAALEELNLAGNYSHGTHVAGIMAAGNPFARLVVARIEFGHTLKPEPCPSVELAQREAKAYPAYVAFLKKHRVQVANMSWGGSVGDVENQLEQCGLGGNAEGRKVLARKIFEIGRTALTAAMKNAPGILFVAAAGNSGSDATFDESIPSSIVLPNLLTVGAVDLAGDEASFTSYGPTVKAHANGYQVLSYVPGGQKIAFSGTSMAAPQVAGLAGKLLALQPTLTPQELIALIAGTTERSADGRRFLIHPKKAREKLGK